MHTAIVVDDEPLARERVRTLLASFNDIRVVAECQNGVEALEQIRRLRPDILLLDVQMPGLDGFGVLAHLHTREMPTTIFITAYDEHAIRAFDVGAADYVLKPIVADRFHVAVQRAIDRRSIGSISAASYIAPILKHTSHETIWMERFAVERNGRLELVPSESVEWLEAEGNYVRIHTRDAQFLLRGTLHVLMTRLNPARFIRIHRSTVVAMDCIATIVSGDHGDATVTLRNGTELKAARVRARALRERLRSR